MLNKYAKNISDIMEYDDVNDVIDDFMDDAASFSDEVCRYCLIGTKELITACMVNALKEDWIYPDMVSIFNDDAESDTYILKIDGSGNMSVQPVIELCDRDINMDVAYVSMDGDVSQIIIDNLINNDVNVILYGTKDEDASKALNGKSDIKIKQDGSSESSSVIYDDNNDILGFNKNWTTLKDSVSSTSCFSFYSNDKQQIKDIAKSFGIEI